MADSNTGNTSPQGLTTAEAQARLVQHDEHAIQARASALAPVPGLVPGSDPVSSKEVP